ncbi:amidase, partial [Pseudomonas syringae pv. tagetis]
GFKPSRGLMRSGPMVGEGWAGLSASHGGAMPVRGSAALLDATAGMDLGAPYAGPVESLSYPSGGHRDTGALHMQINDETV